MTLLAACTSAASTPAEQGADPRAAVAAKASQPMAAAHPTTTPDSKPARSPGPTYRIARRSGEARDESGPLGTHLVAPAGATLTIDLAQGGRLELEAESHAVLLDAEPGTVVLVAGQLYAQLWPQAVPAGRAPLRVVTADFALAIPSAGELWLSARVPYAVVLSGLAELERFVGAEGSPLQLETLTAGQELAGLRVSARAQGPRSLARARAAHVKMRARRTASPGADAVDPELARALHDWDEAQRRVTSLLAEQRAAKQRGDAEAVKAAQRAIVELAQQKLATRRRVRLAFELAAARRLSAAPADERDLEAFSASVATRVAAALPAGL